MEQKRLFEIDALRGIAALIVTFIFHIHHLLGEYRTSPLDGIPVFSWLHEYGYTFVDLFFVISGYIFSHVYLTDGRMNAGPRDFFVARFARLYPLHLVMLLVAAAVFAIGKPATVSDRGSDIYHFVLNLFMLQDSGLNNGLSFNGPSWSISVEVICYLVFFLIAAYCPKALMIISGILAAVGALVTIDGSVQTDHIARGFCGFFVGVIAYRLKGVPLIVWFLLLPSGFLLLQIKSEMSAGVVLSLTSWPAIVNLAFLFAILKTKPFVWLGDRCYSIYLIHSPLYMGLNVVVFGGEPVPPALSVPMMLVGWCLLLVLSDLSYRHFEVPARRWVRGRLKSSDGHRGAVRTQS
jgi:peptidoglycan/LPS O-acetylase OafA/YrhL